MSLCENKSELSSLEMSNNRDRNISPNARQKRGRQCRDGRTLRQKARGDGAHAVSLRKFLLSHTSSLTRGQEFGLQSDLHELQGAFWS